MGWERDLCLGAGSRLCVLHKEMEMKLLKEGTFAKEEITE